MAAPVIGIKETGISEVKKMFSSLPKSTAKKSYKKALKAGGTVVRKLAASKVKSIVSNEATHTLEKGLAVYSLKPKNGNYRVAVQVRRGLLNTKKIVNGEPVRVGLYASVLEYGKKGQPAKSWLRSAAREGAGAALEAAEIAFYTTLQQAVDDAKT